MSADIQQARDVLAKWREEGHDEWWVDRWPVDPDDTSTELVSAGFVRAAEVDLKDARLIVGTAGNPDLLDVLDGMLTTASLAKTPDQVSSWFPRLAAAIIAADKRMTS